MYHSPGLARAASPDAVETNGVTNGTATRDTGMTLADYLEVMTNGVLVTGVISEPSPELEALIEAQLQIMAKQIEALRNPSLSAFSEQNGGGGHE
jgi:hypothetical protein